MRVISGIARGTKLKSLEGLSTRPTLDRVKESLFNIISNYIYDANILDLFSGSAALAIEALSRGAKKATVCDNSKDAIKIIKENLQKTKLYDKSNVINADYKTCLNNINKTKFDIIFLDPPYGKKMGIDAINIISECNLLSDKGIIVLEVDNEEEIPNEIGIYQTYDERKYGRVKLVFFKGKNWEG